MVQISFHSLTIVLSAVCAGTLAAFYATIGTKINLNVINNMPFLPTISETGDYFATQERSVFTISFTFVAFLLMLLVSLIFELNSEMIAQAQIRYKGLVPNYSPMNRGIFVCGIVAALSLSFVSGFKSAVIPEIHYSVVATLFISALMFMMMSTAFLQRISGFVNHNAYQTRLSTTGKLFCLGLSTTGATGMTWCSVIYYFNSTQATWTAFALFEYTFMVGFSCFCLSYWNIFRHCKLGLELVTDPLVPNSETIPLIPMRG